MRSYTVMRNGLAALSIAIVIVTIYLFVTDWNALAKSSGKEAKYRHMRVIQKTRIFPPGGDNVQFDQPWQLSKITVISQFDQFNQSDRYLISNFTYSPGLGNLMFQYASLKAIADANQAKLLIPVQCKLRRAFDLDVIFVTNQLNDFLIKRLYSTKRENSKCCKFDPTIMDHLFENHNFELLIGYFQAYRYFHHRQEALIRKELTFLPEIQTRALSYLNEAKYERLHVDGNQVDNIDERDQADIINSRGGDYFTYVGVHIRHGMDVTLDSVNLKHGHKVVTREYIENAMNYFRSHFMHVFFIIASDNQEWIDSNVNDTQKGEVYKLTSGIREDDMAALIQCNHTIMSTGTFSWWAAYLANGTTVYYNDWPRIGSKLEQMIQKPDYFLDNWISMV